MSVYADADQANQLSHQVPALLHFLRRETDHLSGRPARRTGKPLHRLCEYHQVTPFVFCQLKDSRECSSSGLGGIFAAGAIFEISARNYRLAQEAVDLASLLRRAGHSFVSVQRACSGNGRVWRSRLAPIPGHRFGDPRRDLLQTMDLLIRRGFTVAPVRAVLTIRKTSPATTKPRWRSG